MATKTLNQPGKGTAHADTPAPEHLTKQRCGLAEDAASDAALCFLEAWKAFRGIADQATQQAVMQALMTRAYTAADVAFRALTNNDESTADLQALFDGELA